MNYGYISLNPKTIANVPVTANSAGSTLFLTQVGLEGLLQQNDIYEVQTSVLYSDGDRYIPGSMS